jgi:ligand-binding SRPBCC domain-containing protein
VTIHTLRQSQTLPISAATAWDFFSNPANLARLTPPDLPMRHPGGDQTSPVFPGQMLWFQIRLAPFIWKTWLTHITHVQPGVAFIDEQRNGPYQLWRHHHLITPLTDSTCEITDTIHYALPFQPFGELAHPFLVQPMLQKIFAYRRQALEKIFPCAKPQIPPQM